MPMERPLPPSVYAQARHWNVLETVVNNMRITKRPWIVTKTEPCGETIRETYKHKNAFLPSQVPFRKAALWVGGFGRVATWTGT